MECPICFVTFGKDIYDKHSTECLNNQLKLFNDFKQKEEKKGTETFDLTFTQKAVLEMCEKKSKHYSKNVKELLRAKIISLGYDGKDLHKVEKYFKKVKTVIHFKPEQIIDMMLNDTHFRNLFEVNKSNGSNDKKARASWEDNMFRSMYKDANPFDRVKYGVINIFSTKCGVVSAKGYGHSYIILKDHNKDRITYVHGDSSNKEMHIGSYKGFYHIIYYLDTKILKCLLEKIINNVESNNINYSYIEAQVHGELRFDRDIEKIVLADNLSNKYDVIDKVREFCLKNNCSWSLCEDM